MYKVCLRIILFIAVLIQGVSTSQAQNGDQILDGIGETGMVARYVFAGDVKDWSRNNLHGKIHSTEVKFVDDRRFGKVLSLTGSNNAFVELPGGPLSDIESLSISGWIYLRSKEAGQRFFDFGKDAGKHFFASVSPVVELNKWVQLTIVVDVPSKSMITYIDAKRYGEAKEIPKGFTEVFGQQTSEKKLLYIGKSLSPGSPNLDAMLHDFRIYRVPLSGAQVAGIFNNAQKGLNQVAVTAAKPEDDLPHFSQTEAQLYNIYLTQVSDVEVETEVGSLPRLPSYVQGTYRMKERSKSTCAVACCYGQ